MKFIKAIALAAAVAAGIPSVAHAESWVGVTVADNGASRYSYDADRYVANGSQATFVVRWEQNSGRTDIYWLQVDCRSMTYRIGPSTTYQYQNIIGSDDRWANRWSYIVQNTVAANFSTTVCR